MSIKILQDFIKEFSHKDINNDFKALKKYKESKQK